MGAPESCSPFYRPVNYVNVALGGDDVCDGVADSDTGDTGIKDSGEPPTPSRPTYTTTPNSCPADFKIEVNEYRRLVPETEGGWQVTWEKAQKYTAKDNTTAYVRDGLVAGPQTREAMQCSPCETAVVPKMPDGSLQPAKCMSLTELASKEYKGRDATFMRESPLAR